METFKSISEIFNPDVRSTSFSILDDQGGFREKKLEDHHERIKRIQLSEEVPHDVVNQFETSKNILLYSWFVYRFIPIAELSAVVCLEYALKIKTKGDIRGLRSMMAYAINAGWWKNEDFSHWKNITEMEKRTRKSYEDLGRLIGRDLEIPERRFDFVENLSKLLPLIRNDYAHGSSTLAPGGYHILAECAEAINLLFADKAKYLGKVWRRLEIQEINYPTYEKFLIKYLSAEYFRNLFEAHRDNFLSKIGLSENPSKMLTRGNSHLNVICRVSWYSNLYAILEYLKNKRYLVEGLRAVDGHFFSKLKRLRDASVHLIEKADYLSAFEEIETNDKNQKHIMELHFAIRRFLIGATRRFLLEKRISKTMFEGSREGEFLYEEAMKS